MSKQYDISKRREAPKQTHSVTSLSSVLVRTSNLYPTVGEGEIARLDFVCVCVWGGGLTKWQLMSAFRCITAVLTVYGTDICTETRATSTQTSRGTG